MRNAPNTGVLFKDRRRPQLRPLAVNEQAALRQIHRALLRRGNVALDFGAHTVPAPRFALVSRLTPIDDVKAVALARLGRSNKRFAEL